MRRRVATASTISIHALREEGDVRDVPPQTPYLEISIHALREEGDFWIAALLPRMWKFLSTPSARRATCDPDYTNYAYDISIHALREEGDVFQCRSLIAGHEISIHALREEGDIDHEKE